MLKSMYECAKDLKGLFSYEGLRKKSKLVLRPSYFIDLKHGLRIDTENLEWINFTALLKAKKLDKEPVNDNDQDLIKLITLVGEVLDEKFGDEISQEIKDEIIERFGD